MGFIRFYLLKIRDIYCDGSIYCSIILNRGPSFGYYRHLQAISTKTPSLVKSKNLPCHPGRRLEGLAEEHHSHAEEHMGDFLGEPPRDFSRGWSNTSLGNVGDLK